MPTTGKPNPKRVGITRFVGNIIDDTKEFVDSVLDRARDTERDLRDSAVRTLRYDDDDTDEEREDIETLKAELDRLSERIAALSAPRRRSPEPVGGGAEPVPHQPVTGGVEH